jgi:hypothetical protein
LESLLLSAFQSNLTKQAVERGTDGLHPSQRKVVNEAKRFNVVDCGRRFGKTMLGMNRAKQTLRQGLPVGWFAPTYKLVTEVWAEMRRDLRDEMTGLGNKTEMRLELTNGAIFEMWTLDNPDAGRSRKYARVIVDEAAMVKNLMDAWTASIRPTLTDLKGDAWFLSTPKGRNAFWQLYQLGVDSQHPDWACWQMPTVMNPYIDPVEIEAARQMLPERIFLQEYLAEFLEDGGGVFRRVMEAATATPEDRGKEGKRYLYGVDWGKHQDFTTIVVIDPERRRMVACDRFNQIDYVLQVGRLHAMCNRFKPMAIHAEKNSIGEPIIERLQRDGLPVKPFTTTNASKAEIIEGLSLAFERGEIEIVNDPILIGELLAYDAERLPSGMLRYGAPEGMHDDYVMGLALAWHGCMNSPKRIVTPSISLRNF